MVYSPLTSAVFCAAPNAVNPFVTILAPPTSLAISERELTVLDIINSSSEVDFISVGLL